MLLSTYILKQDYVFLERYKLNKSSICRTSCLCWERKQYEYAGAPVILENSHC